MKKKKYPLVIRMTGAMDQHAHIPRKPLYGLFLVVLIVIVAWLLSGSAKTALLAWQVIL